MKSFFWVTINLIGFLVLIFMYINRDKTSLKTNPGKKLFGYIQIVLMFYLIFDTGMYLIDGRTFIAARSLNYILSMLYYLVTPLPCLLFFLYCDYKILNDVSGMKKRFIYYLVPAAFNTLAVILTPFTKMLFEISENNIYSRGEFFWITIVVGFGYLLGYMFLAIKVRKNNTIAPIEADIHLFLFPIPPAIFAIIQILYHGPLLLGIGFVVSAYYVYTNNILSSEDKRKLSVRFNNLYIAHFVVASFIMIVGMIWSLEYIIKELSGDYADINEVKLFLPFAIITTLFLLFVFSSNRITQRMLFTPLKLLVNSLRNMKEKNEQEIFGLDRDDEIGVLSNTIQELFIKGHYDGLTGIYNRRYLETTMQQTIKSLSRTKAVLSVLLIDIDFFKKYNDTYGHLKGDECLKKIAVTLNKVIERKSDFTARYGGEEFAVILPNTDEAGARAIADKMLNAIRNLQIPHENNKDGIATVSIGITTGILNYTQSWEEYLNKADEALYLSKNSGRDRCTFLAF